MTSLLDYFARPEPVDVSGTPFADRRSALAELFLGPQTGPQVREPEAMRTDPFVFGGGGTAARQSDLAWEDVLASPRQRAVAGVMGSELMSRLMMLANFLGPGPRGPLAFVNKGPSQWVNSPWKDLIVTPRYADVPHAGLAYDGGEVFFNVPRITNPEAWPRGIPDAGSYNPGPRMFRYIDEFRWPFERDTYIRSAMRKDDFDHLNSGRHRGSMNHATGDLEGGLSVAHSVEPAGYKYSYLVKGKRIGQGADSEPLLDVATARPASKLYRTSEMEDILEAELAKWRKRYGVSEEDWRALSNARFPNKAGQ